MRPTICAETIKLTQGREDGRWYPADGGITTAQFVDQLEGTAWEIVGYHEADKDGTLDLNSELIRLIGGGIMAVAIDNGCITQYIDLDHIPAFCHKKEVFQLPEEGPVGYICGLNFVCFKDNGNLMLLESGVGPVYVMEMKPMAEERHEYYKGLCNRSYDEVVADIAGNR